MPIIYIHGVNTRSHDGFLAIKPYLQRLVAPSISADPDHVLIEDVFWGDAAATFAWDGASRPRTRLLGQGGNRIDVPPVERALAASAFEEAFRRLLPMPSSIPETGGLITGASPAGSRRGSLRLRDLKPDELSDLLAVIIGQQVADAEPRAHLSLIADAVAHDASTQAALATARTAEQEIDLLLRRIQQQAQADATLLGMGLPPWLTGLGDRLGETLSRAFDVPTYAVSVAAAELRKPLNELVSVFLADVLVYLNKRGDAADPGEIPQRLLTQLARAHANQLERGGEPIVVLSHSMGGQIVYDAVTHFLPGAPERSHMRIDFWCATASQVGFFEEAKLFLTRHEAYRIGNPVPFPSAHLGAWWNVWDHNDFLSFTTKGIMAGVDDEPFDSGMSLLAAHGGYLQRPSFYRKFAEKLRAAAQRHWRTG